MYSVQVLYSGRERDSLVLTSSYLELEHNKILKTY